MVAPIGLRDDFDAPALRALAKASRDPDQLRHERRRLQLPPHPQMVEASLM